MERTIFKQTSYIITTKKEDEFLCHGVESEYERFENIERAVKFFPRGAAEKVLSELLESNPITDLNIILPITTTYSITEEKNDV